MAKNILIILPSPYVGGNEKFGCELAIFLNRNGFSVNVSIPDTRNFDSLKDTLTSSNITVISASCFDFDANITRRIGSMIRACLNTIRAIWQAYPDLIIIARPSPLAGFSSAFTASIIGKPAISIFQLIHKNHKLPNWQIKFSNWAKKKQIWVAVSEENRQLLSSLYKLTHDKIKLIYNGATLHQVDHTQLSRYKLLEQLSLDTGVKILLTVGALTRQKGHDILLQAFSIFHQDFQSSHLVWVGDGSDRTFLEKMIDELGLHGRVHLLGQQTNIPELLSVADIFVFPSRFEGFPFALVEAMAAGKPIVTTNASSIPELVRDGIEGLLCSPDDPESLAKILRYALSHPEKMQKMADSAKSRSQDFTKEKMFKNYLELIAKILE